MDYFNAFWTGGLICALVQILLDRTSAWFWQYPVERNERIH